MTIPDIKCNPLCVAIVASSDYSHACLKKILEKHAIQVVDDTLLDIRVNDLNVEDADILLVNLDDADEESLDFFINQAELPVLFNDSASIRIDDTPSGRAWGRRLAAKLIDLANIETDSRLDIATDSQPALKNTLELHIVADGESQQRQSLVDEVEIIDEEITELTAWGRALDSENSSHREVPKPEKLTENQTVFWEELIPVQEKADEICVLGASIGGPDAVKRFLMSLSGDIPTGFILAQHIGAGFVSLLAEQLGRVTSINVICAEEGHVIKNNQLIVVPVDQKFGFHSDGRIKLTDDTNHSVYSPSIDDVMTVVAKQYGQNTRAIVFSGMGNDGLKGAQAIFDKGGIVWAQDKSSCVISSMADSVRAAGLVSETATPEKLAMSLVQSMSEEAAL